MVAEFRELGRGLRAPQAMQDVLGLFQRSAARRVAASCWSACDAAWGMSSAARESQSNACLSVRSPDDGLCPGYRMTFCD
jgi:hypothetical protein